MSSCSTSPNQKFVGSCETTHEKVCELRSGVSGQFKAITQTDLCFEFTCKLKDYKSLSDGEKRGERYWGEAIVKPLALVLIL